jgi:hypothetical protein
MTTTSEKNITPDEHDDIMNAIQDHAESYLEDNAVYMSKPWFIEQFQEEIFNYTKTEGKLEGWFFKPYKEHKSNHIIRTGEDDINQFFTLEIDSDEENDYYEENDYDEYWREHSTNICTELLQLYKIPLRECNPVNINSYERETTHIDIIDHKAITNELVYLENVPVQKQRSEEWHKIRHTLFSASNIWKLFGSLAQYNSLLYEKCCPFIAEHNSSTSIMQDTWNPRAWGVKYEPLTIMLYEYMYWTKVKSDYGCVPHRDKTMHIGASPDAINIDETNCERYGRMVEVKNIFNREITGIPSEEYWIQMQVQMEVCNLDSCDFVETRFKEYTCRQEFIDEETTDFDNEDCDTIHDDEIIITKKPFRGVVLFFLPLESINGSGESMYLYSPVQMYSVKEIDKWIATTEEKWTETHILYNTSYWYLDQISCILVKRNELWFQTTIPIIKQAWKTVETERINGYEHRGPKKRERKEKEDISLQKIIVQKLD